MKPIIQDLTPGIPLRKMIAHHTKVKAGRRLTWIPLVAVTCFVCLASSGCGLFIYAQKGETAPPPPPSVEPVRALDELKKEEPLPTPPNKNLEGEERHPRKPPRSKSTAQPTDKLENYEVTLAADPTINIPGPPGLMIVGIGNKGWSPILPEGMTRKPAWLPALGAFARVTPVAPGFKVEPKDSGCISIVPSGSEVSFRLYPTEGGDFEVGANVDLYNNKDCGGARIPKGTTYVKVHVKVLHGKPFIEIFWKKLQTFWGAILGLFFAVLLFLIRKQLKKLIGFGKGK